MLQLCFFVWLIYLIINKRKEDFIFSLFFLGLIISYLVQALFIFDSLPISIIFIFILGFVVVSMSAEERKISEKKPASLMINFVAIFILLSTSIVYLRSIPPARYLIFTLNFNDQQATVTHAAMAGVERRSQWQANFPQFDCLNFHQEEAGFEMHRRHARQGNHGGSRRLIGRKVNG